MALVRIYQKPTGTPANSSVFAVEIQQNNIWYTKKVSWEDLKGLIAGATSLVFNNGTVTFTTPDGVAHEVLSVDDEVLAASGNPVTGGAVSTALAGKQDTLTFDQVPTDGSTNPVESNGIYDALAGKQDVLTFDTIPTDGSTNPVTSQGIYAAISAVTSGIDWKEAVPTYADIATTYPNPQDGWTVTTLDDDHTYRYTGTEWVDLFSLITLATSTKDGLMSSADFTKLSGIEAEANKTIVSDTLTPTTTTKKIATITAGSVAKDINADDTVKVITDLKTPKSATITNGIAQFECIEENLVKGLKVTMNPIQDLSHGDPSPTNICPISGRTEASVNQGSVDIATLYSGQIQSTGAYTGDIRRICNVNNAQMNTHFLKKGTHTLTFNKLNQSAPDLVECTVLTKNDNFEIVDNFATAWHSLPYTFELTADAYVYFTARKDYGTTLNTAYYKTLIIDETHTHQYGQTVYGGEDDFVNGGLTNTFARIDLSTVPITYQTDNGRFYSGALASLAKRISSNDVPPNFYCECYEPQALNSISGDAKMTASTSGSLFIYDSRFDNIEDLRTAMSGVYLYYELATPTTIQTSAAEITTVEGTNIISGTEPISECKYTELATVDDLIKIIGGQ